VTIEPLDPGVYRELVRRALAEDLGWGDVTTTAVVPPDAAAVGRIVARVPLVLAGLDVALEVFRQLDPSVQPRTRRADGDRCAAGGVIAEMRGLAAAMLTAERTALNLLRHLSGIATVTGRLVDEARGRWQVGDTRKTLPLLRALEKYAVRVGGGQNGRLALDDGIIIKRNHARLAGGLEEAVRKAHAAHPDSPIQAEVESVAEADDAIRAGASFILCTAASGTELGRIMERCAGQARVEVSGLRTPEEREAAAAAGADYLSLGCLVDTAPAADITLDIEPA
jgi:nicotinate-nucleotide pyrophosphorylase (carboxylating)